MHGKVSCSNDYSPVHIERTEGKKREPGFTAIVHEQPFNQKADLNKHSKDRPRGRHLPLDSGIATAATRRQSAPP
ncbi:MAG TPA: hypothetical protein DD670_16310 [Planctomycetaceae bacterium]|nr:hypothetical protein [Planctomycetaceae bacterium]